MSEKIEQALTEAVQLNQTLIDNHSQNLSQISEQLVECFDAGGRLILAGAGPMTALAQFIAQHFVFRLSLDRPLLPAIALGPDLSLLNALVRQGEQSQAYVRQLQTLNLTEDDVVLVLADNGYDDGLKGLLLFAQEQGARTVALLQGEVEDHFPVLPDLVLQVETESPARFSEIALLFGNLLCELVEAELFGI